jgi:hypothetical protein
MGSTDLGSSSARGFAYITASDTHVKDKPLYILTFISLTIFPKETT